MSTDLPEIPGDFPEILKELFRNQLDLELRAFQQLVDKLRHKYELQFSDELKAARPGDTFLGLKVTNFDELADTATLQVRVTDADVPFVPGLKIGEATADFIVIRRINLTDNTAPLIDVRGVEGFSIELNLRKEKSYEIRLGYAQDDSIQTQSRIVLVGVKWEEPRFGVLGLLGKTNKGGLLIDLQGESPIAIPLGATGFGLKGIGILYGEHFAPRLDGAVAGNALEHLAKADAGSYADWAQSAKDLSTWLAVPEDIRLYGVSALLADMATGGKLVELRRYGLTYLSYGPTLIFGGETWFLDSIDVGKTVGVIDLRSKSIFGRTTQTLDMIPWAAGAFIAKGSLELSASLSDQKRTYFAVGGYAMDGCSVKLFDFVTLAGGARVVPSQGIAARAKGPIASQLEIGGFTGGYNLSFDIQGGIGWNPAALEAKLVILGTLWIKAFGDKLSLSASLTTELYIKKPLIFKMNVDFEFSCRFGSVHVPLKIFEYENKEPATPEPTLKLAADAPLARMHPPSGIVGQLDPSKPEVWPDMMFVLDFQRRAGDSGIVVNPVDGHVVEAGIDVYHLFTTLMIERQDPVTKAFSTVPDVRASWLLNAADGATLISSRLAIPCNDPLGWLQSFDYAQPSTSRRLESFRLQTFGMGPTRPYLAPHGGQAIARFEDVTVYAAESFWLVAVPWADGYQRALNLRQFKVEFSTSLASGGRATLAVQTCELRILASQNRAPGVWITNGNVQACTLLRPVSNDQGEWSLTIERTSAEVALPLIVSSERLNLVCAIGYSAGDTIVTNLPDTQVLAPGHYRLRIAGESSANFRGKRAPATSHWAVEREFDVVPPPLRPYLRYSTLGDERMFGTDAGGWNPNPAGQGFGHYPDHLCQLRASVSYLHQIYPTLFVRTDNDAIDVEVPVTPCQQGTPAGSKSSGEWRVETGQANPVVVERELSFPFSQNAGFHQITVRRTASDGSGIGDVVDQWTYRVSGYRSPSAHLWTTSTLTRAIGPFGSRSLPHAVAAPVPTGFDLDAVPAAQIGTGWALPKSIASLVGVESTQAGLSFLQLLEWCRIFTGACYPLVEGPFAHPTPSDICLLMDQAAAPAALLLRTSEPCDWRRVEVAAVTSYDNESARRFSLKIVPSPDGCQCAMLFLAEGVPVRIPKGALLLRIRFRLECDPLPRLTLAAAPTQTFEEIVTVLDQPVGIDDWWEK
ncbi:hypothetical protein PFAS1_10970 [Pseudomonas frederiksbergensis]|jgi:hypothetical protein|uniref:hypothetical protein n=1 Tax=Pseudomonas frederiksbergensis TaxID=104087 RepID=UPI0009583F9B|nr:hypothetical protein [Pseudomonas frederiksbergensis]APV39842.1 hypothetical protein PFAS1_10970 [Pseudomonas frederiksbergensis]